MAEFIGTKPEPSLFDLKDEHDDLLDNLAELRLIAADESENDYLRLTHRVAEAIETVTDHMEREERFLLLLYRTEPFDLSSHLICHDVFRRWSEDIMMSLSAHPNAFLAQRCAEYLDTWYRQHLETQDHKIYRLANERGLG